MRDTVMSFGNCPKKTAGTKATRMGKLKMSSKSSWSIYMERVGQTLKQLPQSTQRSGRRTALPSRTRNASVGQIFMQREQPMQVSSSIFRAWKNGVFSILFNC